LYVHDENPDAQINGSLDAAGCGVVKRSFSSSGSAPQQPHHRQEHVAVFLGVFIVRNSYACCG
jgi:hypothetical protein